MIKKTALFACVIAAAVGCRSDRIERDLEFGRTVEPAGDRVDQEHSRSTNEVGSRASEFGGVGGSTGQSHGGDETGAGQGAAAGVPTMQTDEAGHTGPDTGADRQIDQRGTVNQNTGAAVQGRRGDSLTNRSMRSPTPTSGTRSTSPQTTPETTPPEPSSGTSETASGHGTTTDTGINTENAGQGGTDNPQR